MLIIPIMYPENEKQRMDFLNDLLASGADRVLVDWCEIFCDDPQRQKTLDDLKKSIDLYTQHGLEPGVWTTTLGWGDARDEHFQRKFGNTTRITAFDGRTLGAVCVLDEEFLAQMEKNMEDLARTGTRLILLDDDLVLSVRPGFTCSCALHRKEFARRTGREWTGEEIQNLFTGMPNDHRTAWMDLTGETILHYCRRLRAAVDRVDPTIRMGICASYTHYDLDGFDMAECVRILAGEGNRPYLRLTGAAYWPRVSPRYPGQSISGVVEFARMQIGWLENTDIELLDENDPFPRKSDTVPAADVELYDKAMLTQSRVHRLKYILHYGPVREEGDLAYLNAHLNNMSDDGKIADFFAGKTPVGWRIFCAEKKIRTAVLPGEYMGDRPLMSLYTQPYAGALAAKNGIPTRYSGEGPLLVFGEDARHLPNALAKGTILADRSAAAILNERGIACITLELDAAAIDFTNPPDISAILRENYPDLPAFAENLYPIAAKNDFGDELAIMLLNERETSADQAKIFLDDAYILADTVNCTGYTEGNVLTIDRISGRDYAAVLLKKK